MTPCGITCRNCGNVPGASVHLAFRMFQKFFSESLRATPSLPKSAELIETFTLSQPGCDAHSDSCLDKPFARRSLSPAGCIDGAADGGLEAPAVGLSRPWPASKIPPTTPNKRTTAAASAMVVFVPTVRAAMRPLRGTATPARPPCRQPTGVREEEASSAVL